MRRGRFITVEGGDGSGKSTQLVNMRRWFADRGIEVLYTREPGGTEIGEKIRRIILDPENGEMGALTEALLYAASRAQLIEQVIEPALAGGLTVVCDRFVDSSLAYQGFGRGLGGVVREINRPATKGCMPDLTFFLDIRPEAARARIDQSARTLDRLEGQARDFHQKVYEGYKALIAEAGARGEKRFALIDAAGTEEEVRLQIEARLEALFGGGRHASE